MEISEHSEKTSAALPGAVIVGVCLLSLAPAVLHLAGIDFGSEMQVPDAAALADPATASTALHDALRGSIVHGLLEWTAVAVAIFTVVLALAYTRYRTDDVTIVIALALFVSGCVDAFHALAGTHLIEGAADSTNFIPFTWAISRMFHVVVLIVGVAMLLRSRSARADKRPNIALTGGAFAVVAYGIVHICAVSPRLPATMYPDAVMTRPWDFAPLVLFIVAGATLFPALHRRYASSFTQALWLSVVPDIVTESHMAFGSTSLFDSHFQIAHFTKVIAYAVPLSGLVLDYARAYRRLTESNERLEHIAGELDRRASELERANADLQQFAYVSSHDLRAPLRAIDNLASWLSEDLGDSLSEDSRQHLDLLRGRVKRMDELLNALLRYSRIGRTNAEPSEVKLAELLGEIDDMYVHGSGLDLVTPPELPTLTTDVVALRQVLANLVSNAVKHRDDRSTRIEVSCADAGAVYELTVRDDGPGIAPRFHDRVFEMFQTLKPRDEVEGSGMGLAMVKKQVTSCGGSVQLTSDGERGAAFHFTWPKTWQRWS